MTSPITTHVLDTARGKPAPGIPVVLEQRGAGGEWEARGQGATDDDGRCKDLLREGALAAGEWRITFKTSKYFEALGTDAFYPIVKIIFVVRDARAHYHVPLLLSPFGYSTYRGS